MDEAEAAEASKSRTIETFVINLIIPHYSFAEKWAGGR